MQQLAATAAQAAMAAAAITAAAAARPVKRLPSLQLLLIGRAPCRPT